MRERISALQKSIGIAPYWYPILFLLLVVTSLFANHLWTGAVPNRVAFRIPAFDFDVYWYGIWIVAGIGLGAYVVSYLARERGVAVLARHVPEAVQQKPVADLALPAEIERILLKRGIRTCGQLLLEWGFDPRNLGLNRDGVEKVREALAAAPEVEDTWLHQAPWRVWNPDHVWNGIGWCLVLGVIGARLYHVLTPSPSMAAVGIHSPLDYFRNPAQLINLRNGGLGIYGGIAGGVLGLLWYTRRQRMPTMAWADLAAIGMALGQVFGRWGNFFNQELYGRPTNLPWAITIDPLYRLPEYSQFSRFHPAFLYESLWNLLTFLVLLTLLRRYAHKLLTGDLTALYLIFYAIGRILLETVRLDSRTLTLGSLNLSISIATLVSIVVAVAMAAWIIQRRLRAQSRERGLVESKT